MPDPSFAPGPDTARQLRDALGCFGTGVTVVTALTPQGPLGITVNSFASVSLDPALVLWCPGKSSPRHDPFVAARHYSIHVLGQDQLPLAKAFAHSGSAFDQVRWRSDEDGVPHLDGCLARFDCRLHTVHDAGDHSIIIGQVTRVTHRSGQGLMFKRGQFGGFLGLD